MQSHFEESLQQDISRIAAKVKGMAALDERALRDCLKALQEGNRQLAYTVILRDQRIDEMEREIDQLCLNFLVRQQPAGGPLRLAYATIRINLELERIGDYAESIARQVLKLIALNAAAPINRFIEIAELSIPMLHDAVRAFVEQNAELAKSTMKIEEEVDVLRSRINAELFQWRQENKIPLEALTPMMTIARRFERVSDQAKNICQEALYVCTGEYTKHKGEESFRWLFVDEHNSCLSVMAEAIGNSLQLRQFNFSSAGLDAKPVEERTLNFMKEKGLNPPKHSSRSLSQIQDFDHFHIVVTLGESVQKAMPAAPRKTFYFDWIVADPSQFGGAPNQVKEAYEKTYQALRSHILDLVEAILGDKVD
jgi:phosphate transport system protein